MKARVRVAIAAMRPDKEGYWKNMSRFMKPRIQIGKNIDTKLTPGYLYSGILK